MVALQKKGDDLSAIEPVTYQSRFYKVISKRVITVCDSEKKSMERLEPEADGSNFDAQFDSRFKYGSDSKKFSLN